MREPWYIESCLVRGVFLSHGYKCDAIFLVPGQRVLRLQSIGRYMGVYTMGYRVVLRKESINWIVVTFVFMILHFFLILHLLARYANKVTFILLVYY